MQGTGSVKVPDGKLVRVSLTYDDRIRSASVTGDFFLEPPEALSDLEAAMEGLPTDVGESELVAAIETVDAHLIGFGPADLAEATMEAIR
ncbi:MAG: hypothetical protein ACOCUO_02540 [archaeon]